MPDSAPQILFFPPWGFAEGRMRVNLLCALVVSQGGAVLKPTQALLIPIGRSLQLALFILLVHALPLFACWVLPVPLYYKLLCVLVSVASGIHSWHHLISQQPGDAVDLLILDEAGDWYLRDRAGRLRQAQLLASSFVSPALIILSFSLREGGQRRLVMLPDSVDPDLLRRLRVRLLDQAVIRRDKPPHLSRA